MKVMLWMTLDITSDGKASYELECRNLGAPGVGIPVDLLQKVVPRVLEDLASRNPVMPSQERPSWGLGRDEDEAGSPRH